MNGASIALKPFSGPLTSDGKHLFVVSKTLEKKSFHWGVLAPQAQITHYSCGSRNAVIFYPLQNGSYGQQTFSHKIV